MPVIKNAIYEVPQNTEKGLADYPVIPLLGIDLKKCKQGYNKDRCTPTFIETLLIIAKLWNDTICPISDEHIKKMWCLYKSNFFSTMKYTEILSFKDEWMKLKNITLSEFTQFQIAKGYMFYLICL
jgi:hypothetical protein